MKTVYITFNRCVCMKKQCHVYSVEYYSVIMFSKINKLWVPAIIWLNLRDFMLSERSQSQNSMFPLECCSYNTKLWWWRAQPCLPKVRGGAQMWRKWEVGKSIVGWWNYSVSWLWYCYIDLYVFKLIKLYIKKRQFVI